MTERELVHKKLMIVCTGALISLLALGSSVGLPQATDGEDMTSGETDEGEVISLNETNACNAETPTSKTSNDIVGAAPDEATLIAPTGPIETKNPTYTWNEVIDCLWYHLEVENSSGIIVEHWYKAEEITSGSICSVTPSEALSSGKYIWRVQTSNCDGDGPWSEEESFSVCVSTAKPGRVTLASPKGTIGTTSPTYIWSPVADSSRYCLKVNGPSGYTYSEWYSAEDVTADSICSLISPEELVPGDYTWQIQTGNCIGDGPWSALVSFKVTNKPPARVATISPKGLISTRTPIFTWSAVPGSTQYHLSVENDSETIIDEWFAAEEVTRGYRCSVLSPMILPDDDADFYWRVQASNDIGDGLWSSYKYFEAVCSVAGTAKEQKRQTSAEDGQKGCGCQKNKPSQNRDA